MEPDSHSDGESVSMISDDENEEGGSVTIPIMNCEAQVSICMNV